MDSISEARVSWGYSWVTLGFENWFEASTPLLIISLYRPSSVTLPKLSRHWAPVSSLLLELWGGSDTGESSIAKDVVKLALLCF